MQGAHVCACFWVKSGWISGSGSLFSLIDTGFRREGACLAGDEVGAMTWYRSVLTPAVFVTELCFWEIRSGNG